MSAPLSLPDPDHLLVVDLEATCWRGAPPPDQINEIIEIGVCVLALDTGAISHVTSILVRPQRSVISPFCAELTTLTQEQVDQGVSFLEACAMLAHGFAGGARAWSSWGDFDRRMLRDQCHAFGVDYPLSAAHINLKKVYAKGRRLKHRPGLREALEQLGLTLEGTHHRGVDDAYNAARIAAQLLRDGGRNLLLGTFSKPLPPFTLPSKNA